MNRNIIKNNKVLRQSIILLVIFCSIISSIIIASAVDKTYYWDRTTGVSIAGFTTNWSSCSSSSPQNGFRVTSIGSSASSCTNGQLTRSNAGDLFLAIFPTAYTSDTQIRGMTNARFYLRSNSGSATYRFDLGYTRTGIFTSLGSVTRTGVSTTGTTYPIDLSTISGTAPAGSDLALKVSVTTSGGGRVYMGTNGGTRNSNSGRFYVNETVAAPSYSVSASLTPSSQNVENGSQVQYTLAVQNNGNTADSYTLSLNNPDTANFIYSLALTSTGTLNPGASFTTTMTVASPAVAATGSSHTQSVKATGASTTNSNTVTTTVVSTPTQSGGQIHVATNRYVILDDWTTAGIAGTEFSVPGMTHTANSWTGKNTRINATVLYMDNGGLPLAGKTITFNLYQPNNAEYTAARVNATTNAYGLASFSFDMDKRNYYGNWIVKASSGSVSDNTSFIYNWWGCGSSDCGDYHISGNPSGTATINSPYLSGREEISSLHSTHTSYAKKCTDCHQSFDGKPGGNTASDAQHTMSPQDVHRNLTCDTAGCHQNSATHNSNQNIGSCYSAACHTPANRADISRKSTLSSSNVASALSLYSISSTAFNATFHTPNSTVPCTMCHGPMHNITKPDGTQRFIRNTNTEPSQCWSCHTQRPAHYGTSCTGCHSQDAHNISASGGGPDCILCHGLEGTAAHKVDENAIATGVHGNLNSEATASDVSAANKKCWGCHQSDGNQPTDMGNKYNTPYKCYECHGPTKPYVRVGGAMTINEHFKSGADVKAGIFAIDNSSSCALCHSLPEMRVSYTDNEFSELSVGSHYGKNRSGTLDCKYCHQNTSTAFAVGIMSNIQNNNLSNHSSSPLTPVCTTCHGSGMLHNATLTKPVNSNDAYCKTCHGNKNEHKTVYCAECHTNNTDGSKAGRDIHGIKYLLNNNTFSISKTNAVDCTTCHQKSTVDGTIGMVPPKINDTLHHSDDPLNGSKWGIYWTSPINACLYCHNDTRHNAIPLGRPLIWNSTYVMNTIIGSGTNCADCHYKGDANYNKMKSAFMTSSKPIPPEITNGSWNGKTGYYNHTLNDYSDAQCKNCHYKGTGTTVGQMLHNISVGGGGPDCKACHDVGSVSAPELVNFSAMNSVSAGHKDLNSAASATVNVENVKCWACHGDGTQPDGHPSGYRTPKDCTNCHTGTGSYDAPIAAEHNPAGQDVKTSVNCTQCHDNNGMYISGTGVGTVNHYVKYVTNTATTPYGHPGPINTSNCNVCHNGQYTNNPDWGSPVNISTLPGRPHPETNTVQCDSCHKDSTISTLAKVDFHNAALTAGAGGANCLGCHANAE